jgi:hypothetical protein
MDKAGAPRTELLTGGANWQLKCAVGSRQTLMPGIAIRMAGAIE